MAAAASTAKAKSPAEEQLEQLDAVYGPGAFLQSGRVVLTVARDLIGIMKVAHKLQSKINEHLGSMVEVFMEHVKQELWVKLQETTSSMGMSKGPEMPNVQVTHIPEGIRIHPYKRDQLPSLEILLLWDDSTGTTRGHCIYTMAHPEVPGLEQVDSIFEAIQPYFAKRWVLIELTLAPPVKGEFEEEDEERAAGEAPPPHDCQEVGAGVDIAVLACHPYGFAHGGQAESVANVRQCQPLVFRGSTDESGRAKLCFLPADINKVQVAETERFHGSETVLLRSKLLGLEGVTSVPIELTPKVLCEVSVHVFAMPRQKPAAEDTDGIIDWAAETREALPMAAVEVMPLKDGAVSRQLVHTGDDSFTVKEGGLAEGCVVFAVSCDKFVAEERTMMLLPGANEFYIPLTAAS